MLRVWIILFGLFMVGCQPQELEVIDFQHYVEDEDNGLSVKTEDEDIAYQIQYNPPEYMAFVECRNASDKKRCYKESVDKFQQMEYFTLRIIAKKSNQEPLKWGAASMEEYQDRVMYCSSQMQQDIQLLSGEVSKPCKIFHFERTYDIAPFCNFLIGFERSSDEKENIKDKKIEDRVIVINDKLFNFGEVKLKVKGKDISAIPKLKIQ